MPAIGASRYGMHKPKGACIALENNRQVKREVEKSTIQTMPVLARMIAVLVFLIAPLNSAPSATVSSSITGTPLPLLKYPKGAVKINLGGRDVMVNHQAMGSGATKSTIRAMDEAFTKFITSATNINFDACHQPIVLTSNRFLALGCSNLAAGAAAINDLSWNSGTDTYAWTPSYGSATAFSATNNFGRSLQDSGNFVYSLKNSSKAATNDVLVYKLDGSVPQSIGSATMVTCTLFASGPQGREINWLADPFIFVVYATVTTFTQEGIAIIDKTSMTQVGIYPTTKLNSIVERYRSTQNLFFIANENSATTYGFSKVLIGASPTFGVTVQDFWATGGSDIVTMWASPLMSTVYVHVAASSPTNLVQLVNAYTMSTEGTLTFTETPVRYAPTLWSTTAGREYYFTIGTTAPGSATMFTRTMVWLDFCLTPGQNPCLQCQAGRYLNSALTENLCVTTYDFPAGYGINGFYMGPCLGDLAKGCLICPATTSVCTVCDTANGFYLETISGQCYSVATMPTGFGLNTGTNLVEACTTANCQKCSSDKTVCTGCIPGYYIRVDTNTCVLNNVIGYGLDVSTLTIKGCSSGSCLDCYSDITQCNQCAGGDLLYFHNRSCTTVAGDGYGPQTITGTTYLVNCLTSSCQTCSLDYSACTKCNKGNVLTSENKCISIEPIRLTNTPFLDKETYIFDLEFSDTIDQEDYLSLLNYQCYDINQRPMSLDKCSFGLIRTRNLSVQGQFHHSLDLSTLNQIVISHRNIDKPAFHNARKKFVEENDISITPRQNLESTVNSTYAKPVIISTMAVSAFTVTALMNRELPLLKVIDTLEYILYENGIHMWKSDSFIRSVDAKPFSILPNMLGSDKENLKCLAPVNFAKEGISCSLLNNYGSELLTLMMFLVVGFIFAGLNVFIERISLKFPNMTLKVNEKYPKFAKYSKKILGYFTALLSRQILVKVFEGSQIGIFRLAFLNLYTLNTEAPMIWGAIVSCILLLLNILLGISFFKFAKTRSRLIIKCVEMKRKYEHVLEIPPPPKDDLVCLLVAPLYFEYKITAKGKKSIHLWYPLMELLYNGVVQCILVVTTGDNLVQVWLITFATLAHFGVATWTRPYIHRVLNLKLALQTFIFGAIQITIVAVNHSKDQVPPLDREKGYAWTLIVLCCGAIVANLIPTFFTVYELIAPVFQRGKNRAVSPIFKKSALSAFGIILRDAENQSNINASTFEKTNRKEEETTKKKKKIKMYLRPDKNANTTSPVADEKGGKLEFDASKEDICEQNGKYKNEVSTSRTMRPSLSKENTNEEGHSPEPNLRTTIKKRKNQTTGSPVPAGKKRVKSPSNRKA